MKLSYAIIFTASLLFISCSKDDSVTENQSGTLVLKAVKTLSAIKSIHSSSNATVTNQNANVYQMHTLDFKFNIAEIWVSQDEFNVGGEDNLKWYKIGENNQMKLFGDYSFTAENLPVGVYRSIKIKLKTLFYRIAAYKSDRTKVIEMLERNGDWNGSCTDFNDFAPINYFNSKGNHQLVSGKFKVVAEGEKLTGFEIKPSKITNLYWKLGDEREFDPYACYFDWIDENNNGIWDCGIDRQDNYQCDVTPPYETMWIFIPKYQ